MARILDLLDTLGVAEDGITTAYPETFLADARAAFTDDAAAYDAKIQVLTADLAAANEKILALQAHNYELMTSLPVTDNTDAEDESTDDEPEDESNDDNSGVDSLFGNSKDDN